MQSVRSCTVRPPVRHCWGPVSAPDRCVCERAGKRLVLTQTAIYNAVLNPLFHECFRAVRAARRAARGWRWGRGTRPKHRTDGQRLEHSSSSTSIESTALQNTIVDLPNELKRGLLAFILGPGNSWTWWTVHSRWRIVGGGVRGPHADCAARCCAVRTRRAPIHKRRRTDGQLGDLDFTSKPAIGTGMQVVVPRRRAGTV